MDLLKIDGVVIKKPKDFDIERYDLTKSGRLASGKMTMDIVAKKRKFTFSYDVLSGTDLEVILGVIDTMVAFKTIEYIENNVVKTAVVYTGPIKAKKFRTDGVWYWKNVTFNLIEQ